MNEQMPSIGRIVHYTNLGDKDGKYPPEIQAALITGVYKHAPANQPAPPQEPGNNDPALHGLASANTLGDKAESYMVDLKVEYRTGTFTMRCVPFSPEPKRGHWNYPPRV
jgi:hypothetical protein